jgi:hypothetical protein
MNVKPTIPEETPIPFDDALRRAAGAKLATGSKARDPRIRCKQVLTRDRARRDSKDLLKAAIPGSTRTIWPGIVPRWELRPAAAGEPAVPERRDAGSRY